MKINWTILVFALYFSLIETIHFGWNASPKSDAELICDGIALLIASLAFLKVSHE